MVTCWERVDLLALVGDVYCIFVTFPCDILGQVWYLIASFPDLCRLSYFSFYTFDFDQVCGRLHGLIRANISDYLLLMLLYPLIVWIWSLTGADPGFLERVFVCINVWGFALLILSHFSKISHENEIIWSH